MTNENISLNSPLPQTAFSVTQTAIESDKAIEYKNDSWRELLPFLDIPGADEVVEACCDLENPEQCEACT